MAFPSPCGVNIVANKAELLEEIEKENLFPSPCGVNIVANVMLNLLLVMIAFKCFRPLAG